jgi:hypothetical protein
MKQITRVQVLLTGLIAFTFSGCAPATSEPTPIANPQATLEVSVGTMNSLSVGTLFLVRARKNGAPPTIDATVGLATTPGATSMGAQFYPANLSLGRYLFETTPLAGTYDASLTLGSEIVRTTATLSDPKQILPLPKVTANQMTVSSVPATWETVPGAQSYEAALISPSEGKTLAESALTTQTNITLTPQAALDPKKLYVVIVTAYSANLTDPNISLKTQVNAASSSGPVAFK